MDLDICETYPREAAQHEVAVAVPALRWRVQPTKYNNLQFPRVNLFSQMKKVHTDGKNPAKLNE